MPISETKINLVFSRIVHVNLSSWSLSSSQVASNNLESCPGAPLSPIPVCKVHGIFTRVLGSCSILFDIDADWHIVLEFDFASFFPQACLQSLFSKCK